MIEGVKVFSGEHLDAQQLERWLTALPEAEGQQAREHLVRTASLCAKHLADLKERSGQQLSLYSFHVADQLCRLEMDDDTITAMLLYRLIVHDFLDEAHVETEFGTTIAALVKDLLLIQRFSPTTLRERDAKGDAHSENLRRMLLAISSDVRAVLIQLAERLHLMRRLKYLAPDLQQQFSRNTLDIFAPLANRLGIWQIKWELEDLSLRYLEPEDYRSIATQLDERRTERLAFLSRVVETLLARLAEQGIKAKVSARPKHIFSIWKKMRRKAYSFEHVFDVRAVRILVDSLSNCYASLGVVHGLWRHLPHEFDDYIATPKANLYRSIHTVVIGPEDKPLEVQIRTHEMHMHAERGIAAHWRYKERHQGGTEMEQRIEWMRHWLEHRDTDESTAEKRLAADFRQDQEQTRVYVLTPQGKVIELAYGATPIDFAYAIHTSIGHRCRGAKIDGQIVPLNRSLQSGQTVEILTHKEERPSRDWMSPRLGYVTTAKALNRLKTWFRQQDYADHLELGKANLERECVRQGVDKLNLVSTAARLNFKTTDDLLAAIGRGDVSPIQVAGWGQGGKSMRQPKRKRRSTNRIRQGPNLLVEGVGDLMAQLAKCCKPVPGDSIVGYITRGRGISVHRKNCPSLLRFSREEPDRLVDVRWGSEDATSSYKIDMCVVAFERKGILRDIFSLLSNEDVDVLSLNSHSDKQQQRTVLLFSLEINGVKQLNQTIDKLMQLPDVIEVSRI